jgi:hypothetical protein
MEIAKGIQADDYLNLDLSDYTSGNWNTAFEIMSKRLNERFIEPADKLIELEDEVSPKDKKYGFAILALDCLLCETIQAFYIGIGDSTGQSKALFKEFLELRVEFKDYFKTEQERENFYKNFRCGILHQAQTSKDTKVWSVGSLISESGKFIIVNRQEFHKKVKKRIGYLRQRINKKRRPSING